MIRFLLSLFGVFSAPARSSSQLFRAAIAKVDINDHPETKDAAVEALVNHIKGGTFKMKQVCSFTSVSTCGCVAVERDVYGPEIKLMGGWKMLDCAPAYYNLTAEQASLIYDAICDHIYKRTIDDD